MTCDLINLTAMQEQQREAELRDLEAKIKANKVKVKVKNTAKGRTVEFVGWEPTRTGPGHWHDDCAYRKLMAEGSSTLRRALARTQTGSGTERLATNG
jgi:hypothetical protein